MLGRRVSWGPAAGTAVLAGRASDAFSIHHPPPPEIRLIYSLAALGLCSFWSGRRGACCCAFN